MRGWETTAGADAAGCEAMHGAERAASWATAAQRPCKLRVLAGRVRRHRSRRSVDLAGRCAGCGTAAPVGGEGLLESPRQRRILPAHAGSRAAGGRRRAGVSGGSARRRESGRQARGDGAGRGARDGGGQVAQRGFRHSGPPLWLHGCGAARRGCAHIRRRGLHCALAACTHGRVCVGRRALPRGDASGGIVVVGAAVGGGMRLPF
eukprot:scaffold6781_cov107-Isochrysis_galbana.AAC.5